jgi:hypothetical protein
MTDDYFIFFRVPYFGFIPYLCIFLNLTSFINHSWCQFDRTTVFSVGMVANRQKRLRRIF